jgi:hypothetical protein
MTAVRKPLKSTPLHLEDSARGMPAIRKPRPNTSTLTLTEKGKVGAPWLGGAVQVEIRVAAACFQRLTLNYDMYRQAHIRKCNFRTFHLKTFGVNIYFRTWACLHMSYDKLLSN